MKMFIKILLMPLLFTFVISVFADAKQSTCIHCQSALDLEKTIANSGIVPDQSNNTTIPKQDEFINSSALKIKSLLQEKNFDQQHAYAVLKLLSRIACFYDNAGSLPLENRTLFKKIYDQPKNVLKTELQSMVQKKEISKKRSLAMLEAIGAIPSNDYLANGCRDYK